MPSDKELNAWKDRPSGVYFIRNPDAKDYTAAWLVRRWDAEYAKTSNGHGWIFSKALALRDFHVRTGEPQIICGGPVVPPEPERGFERGYAGVVSLP